MPKAKGNSGSYAVGRATREAMFALFEAAVDGLSEVERPMVFSKRQAAEIFFQKWYGVAMLAEFKGESFDMRGGIAHYLADVALMPGLKLDDILRFGTLIPDEVAEVYTLTLKAYSDLKKQHEGTL